ncbi:MAG: LCP family protein [Patescibacteria group bacterium]
MRYVNLEKNKSTPRSRRPNSRKGKTSFFLGVFIIFFILLGFFLISRVSLSNLLSPIATLSRVVNPKEVQATEGRTNILLLALDRRDISPDPNCEESSGLLTDTIIVASLKTSDEGTGKDAVLLSIPRDLWVDTGYFSGKVNSAYAVGEKNNDQGTAFASRVVEGVLGLPIHYYAVIDFSGFKQGVDILGGIEVDVEQVFDDYRYPIPGKECAEPKESRWEHIHFDAGPQIMDGEKALKFVRSRKAQGPEGSDFARSRRQQKVLLAMRDKALSLSLFSDFGEIRNLYDTFNQSVETNISWPDVQKLAPLVMNIETVDTHVLDGGQGLLKSVENNENYGGSWVLVPTAGNFGDVRDYVSDLLFAK